MYILNKGLLEKTKHLSHKMKEGITRIKIHYDGIPKFRSYVIKGSDVSLVLGMTSSPVGLVSLSRGVGAQN